jgi:hypothetical protein
MSIFSGLKTYKDRMDTEKSSMNLYIINMWNLIDNKDMSDELKKWCKITITTSSQIYEFLINNYRDSFKGVQADNGIKEIVGYLLFHTIIVGGDPFFNKAKFNSISELIMEVGYIFEFEKQTYLRTDSYVMTYKNTKERNIASESQLLLYAVITATNPSMKEIPERMKIEFMTNLTENTILYNKLLEKEGLL